jgi:hypothetical protein
MDILATGRSGRSPARRPFSPVGDHNVTLTAMVRRVTIKAILHALSAEEACT